MVQGQGDLTKWLTSVIDKSLSSDERNATWKTIPTDDLADLISVSGSVAASRTLLSRFRAAMTKYPHYASHLRSYYTESVVPESLQNLKAALIRRKNSDPSTDCSPVIFDGVSGTDFGVVEFLDELLQLDSKLLDNYPLLLQYRKYIHDLDGR